MKLAHVNYIPSITSLLGVYKKICQQSNAARQSNLNIHFYVLTNEANIDVSLKHNTVTVVHFSKTEHPAQKIVDFFNDRYDCIICRSLGFTPLTFFYLKQKKFKLITEHHGKEFNHILLTGNIRNIIFELLSARAIFSQVDGIIAMTPEIRDYEIQRGFKKPNRSIFIGNGIDVDSVQLTKFKASTIESLNLVFIASRPNEAWHGLDRLISGMKHYQGSEKVCLNIVGDMQEDDLPVQSKGINNIIFHGVKHGEELDKLMTKMNLAIGTLGAHRKGLSSACSLKVREYTARGIPFALSYDDVDLREDLPFYLKIPANDKSVDLNRLINFHKELKNKFDACELSSLMRAYALKHMDWKPKLNQYVDFAYRLNS